MTRCLHTPVVVDFASTGAVLDVVVPTDARSFIVQIRQGVDATLTYRDNDGGTAQVWTLKAGTTYGEENLQLPNDLHLAILVATGNNVELVYWT